MKKTANRREKEKEKDGAEPKGVKLRPCAVCEADSTGYHFGVMSCEACKSFFRRSLKRRADMMCAKDGHCNIKYGEVKGTPCPACRVNRCVAVGMSLNAVKKGRYTLERRAETIKESKEYWTSVTDPLDTPTPTGPSLTQDPLYPFPISTSTASTNGSLQATSSKRHSLSFSSNSNSFDSDPGLQLPDEDLMLSPSGGGGVIGLLGDGDPGLLKTNESDLNLLNTEVPGFQHHHQHQQPINDVFMSQSPYGTRDRTIKSLLTAPLSPVFPPTPDSSTSNALTDGSSPLSNPRECLASDSHAQQQQQQQNGGNNSMQISRSMDNIIIAQLNEHAGLFSNGGGGPQHQLAPQEGDADASTTTNSQSESIIDKLLGLKTLFKDPSNVREFKTDYLKGFNTEKQDCDSIGSLFKSVQHPADALDFALVKADDENLDKLIDRTIEAFDKQNFLTRGFLAKMPDYQHRFLLEKEEKERLFGPMKPLSFQEHKQIFDETGIDVDGRQALMQHFADSVLVPHYRKVTAYITSLPGVRTLPVEDQYALLKYTKAEVKIAALFPVFNVSHKLYTISEGQVGITLGYDELLIYHSKDVMDCGFEIAGKLQDMELTDQEYAMVAAVCIIKSEVCVTEEGKDKCCTIRSRMFKALERLLCRRVSSAEAHKVVTEVQGFIEMFREKRNNFNEEWDQMFKENLHIQWPRFVWDLLVTPFEAPQ